MSLLQNKSLTELRGIAQSFGIGDIFKKDKVALLQAIELKQQSLAPKEKLDLPRPDYDARLMTRPPAKLCLPDEAMPLLQPLINRGLQVRFDEERWYFSIGKQTDEGTLRMPLRVMLTCAERLMNGR